MSCLMPYLHQHPVTDVLDNSAIYFLKQSSMKYPSGKIPHLMLRVLVRLCLSAAESMGNALLEK